MDVTCGTCYRFYITKLWFENKSKRNERKVCIKRFVEIKRIKRTDNFCDKKGGDVKSSSLFPLTFQSDPQKHLRGSVAQLVTIANPSHNAFRPLLNILHV